MPCEAPRSDRRMDSTGGRGRHARSWKAASGGSSSGGRAPRSDREPSRPGGCSHPAWRPPRRCPGASRPCCSRGRARSRGAICARRWRPCTGASSPARDSVPAATVDSGALVTIDTVSHEGILEDQGRDPVAFFARHGIPADKVLNDAKALAASSLSHDGPCVVSGPVAVRGAEPGDILQGRRARARPARRLRRDLQPPRQGHQPRRLDLHARAPRRGAATRVQLRAGLPLDPCLGIMGVAGDNADAADGLGVGSSLYLPVLVPGAKFFAGDPHYAQDGTRRARGAAARDVPAHGAAARHRAAGDRARRLLGRARTRGRVRAAGDQRLAGLPGERARDVARGGLRLPGARPARYV